MSPVAKVIFRRGKNTMPSKLRPHIRQGGWDTCDDSQGVRSAMQLSTAKLTAAGDLDRYSQNQVAQARCVLPAQTSSKTSTNFLRVHPAHLENQCALAREMEVPGTLQELPRTDAMHQTAEVGT